MIKVNGNRIVTLKCLYWHAYQLLNLNYSNPFISIGKINYACNYDDIIKPFATSRIIKTYLFHIPNFNPFLFIE